MTKNELLPWMLELLRESLDEDLGPGEALGPRTPLLGGDAVASSLELVSFVGDLEMALEEDHGLELTLVSEEALSRRKSPFRHVEALADYVLELVAVAPAA